MCIVLESLVIAVLIGLFAFVVGVILVNTNNYLLGKIKSKRSIKVLQRLDKFLTK